MFAMILICRLESSLDGGLVIMTGDDGAWYFKFELIWGGLLNAGVLAALVFKNVGHILIFQIKNLSKIRPFWIFLWSFFAIFCEVWTCTFYHSRD